MPTQLDELTSDHVVVFDTSALLKDKAKPIPLDYGDDTPPRLQEPEISKQTTNKPSKETSSKATPSNNEEDPFFN